MTPKIQKLCLPWKRSGGMNAELPPSRSDLRSDPATAEGEAVLHGMELERTGDRPIPLFPGHALQ